MPIFGYDDGTVPSQLVVLLLLITKVRQGALEIDHC